MSEDNPKILSYKSTSNVLPRDAMISGILANPDEILFEDEYVYIVTNVFPSTSYPNCMVIPKRYVEDMADLSKDEAYAVLCAVEKVSAVLEKECGLPCMTLKYGGAHTTQDHLHIHIMPTEIKFRDLYYDMKGMTITKMAPDEVSDLKIKLAPLLAK